ncbi:MAG TPA: DUF4388 domain-containing protein, partial [Acidimicrobiia bacterium]|nr:DUF4388 domain-containing protein [Acidimicrobiia bacterium]
VTLSGTLSFVPLDEVLRLMTRCKKEGAVEVIGDGFQGRVFVGRGGIDLATISDDDILNRHLTNSRLADEDMLRRITAGETTLAAQAESNQLLIDLLREMTVESVYQISTRGNEFDVVETKTTPYASPNSFDLEELITDSHARRHEWAEVSETVHDLSSAITLRRDLGDRDEVAIKNDDWKVLSVVQDGRSVEEMADRLGTTEFWTARVVARLMNNELVEFASETLLGRLERTPDRDQTAVSAGIFGNVSEDTADEDSDDSVQGNETDEPVDDTGAVDGDQPEDGEDSSGIPTIEDADSKDDEEDAGAFVEKVFSELGSDESESEEGKGLLSRRISTLRDRSSDS